MSGEAGVRDAFAKQSVWCERLGSPFTAMLMDCLGRSLDRATATGRAVLDWAGAPDAMGDAVPLRLAGALHALVRRGRLPQLASLYPPAPLSTPDRLAGVALEAIADADDEIVEWLTHAPQTNEIARSGVLYPGMMVIAGETGLPLSLFEIGASAGLNLFPDRFAYELNGEMLGRRASPVTLAPAWAGSPLVGREPRIVGRRGCDRNPLDVTDAAHRERLIGYIWPDQDERLARVQAAIAIARENPPAIDAADAADWIERVIVDEAPGGQARVVFHSIALQYFPQAAKDRITARMEQAGARATSASPLAWLAFEQFGDEGPRLTLRLWPGGEERLLAKADAHVHALEWLGG